MSGGSYDYAYLKIQDLAEDVDSAANRKLLPKRMAFAELLRLCAEAAREIEWVDSGDSAAGSEDEALERVFEFLYPKGEDILRMRADLAAVEKIRGMLR